MIKSKEFAAAWMFATTASIVALVSTYFPEVDIRLAIAFIIGGGIVGFVGAWIAFAPDGRGE